MPASWACGRPLDRWTIGPPSRLFGRRSRISCADHRMVDRWPTGHGRSATPRAGSPGMCSTTPGRWKTAPIRTRRRRPQPDPTPLPRRVTTARISTGDRGHDHAPTVRSWGWLEVSGVRPKPRFVRWHRNPTGQAMAPWNDPPPGRCYLRTVALTRRKRGVAHSPAGSPSDFVSGRRRRRARAAVARSRASSARVATNSRR